MHAYICKKKAWWHRNLWQWWDVNFANIMKNENRVHKIKIKMKHFTIYLQYYAFLSIWWVPTSRLVLTMFRQTKWHPDIFNAFISKLEQIMSEHQTFYYISWDSDSDNLHFKTFPVQYSLWCLFKNLCYVILVALSLFPIIFLFYEF